MCAYSVFDINERLCHGELPIHKILHQARDAEKIQRSRVNQRIRFAKPKQQIRHVILMPAYAWSFHHAIHASDAMLNPFVLQKHYLSFGACLFCSLQEFFDQNLRVAQFSARASVDREYFHF